MCRKLHTNWSFPWPEQLWLQLFKNKIKTISVEIFTVLLQRKTAHKRHIFIIFPLIQYQEDRSKHVFKPQLKYIKRILLTWDDNSVGRFLKKNQADILFLVVEKYASVRDDLPCTFRAKSRVQNVELEDEPKRQESTSKCDNKGKSQEDGCYCKNFGLHKIPCSTTPSAIRRVDDGCNGQLRAKRRSTVPCHRESRQRCRWWSHHCWVCRKLRNSK